MSPERQNMVTAADVGPALVKAAVDSFEQTSRSLLQTITGDEALTRHVGRFIQGLRHACTDCSNRRYVLFDIPIYYSLFLEKYLCLRLFWSDWAFRSGSSHAFSDRMAASRSCLVMALKRVPAGWSTSQEVPSWRRPSSTHMLQHLYRSFLLLIRTRNTLQGCPESMLMTKCRTP